jgi:glycosyltransferase involved in cell wall biosynthesis
VIDEPVLDFLLPGDPQTLTGGYIYDRRIAEGLVNLGWRVAVHSLDASFPFPTPLALTEARTLLESIPTGRIVVIDGLALGSMPEPLADHADRLRLMALIHHPLACETGLSSVEQQKLKDSEQRSLSAVRGVFVNSHWTKQKVAGYGVDLERIHVVPPGTDPAPLAGGSGSASLQLLCVATLTPRKGHADLFDALAQLRDRSWYLRCVGSLTRNVDTVSALRKQITQLDLTDRVELLGEVTADALAHCYETADLFVLASYLEGYGMVHSEALSRGLPLVCTSAGAVPETVEANAALLVPEGNVAGLVCALTKVMDDRSLLSDLASGARIARDNLPSWDQAAAQFAAGLRVLL